MLLGIKMLDPLATNVNNLAYINQVYIYPGSQIELLFQFVNPVNGQRYIPASGATVQIAIRSVNDSYTVVKPAVTPYADDRSIWRAILSPSDTLNLAGVNLEVELTEGSSVRRVFQKSVLIIMPKSPYQC